MKDIDEVYKRRVGIVRESINELIGSLENLYAFTDQIFTGSGEINNTQAAQKLCVICDKELEHEKLYCCGSCMEKQREQDRTFTQLPCGCGDQKNGYTRDLTNWDTYCDHGVWKLEVKNCQEKDV